MASSDGRELAEEQVARLEGFGGVEAESEYDLAFFNEKDVDIGLSRLSVVFVAENGTEGRVGLTDTRQGLYPVNAVSRRWSEAKVTGVISGPDSRLVRDWHAIEVRGAFPDHRLYKDEVMKRVGR
jgi:hypothetical protein